VAIPRVVAAVAADATVNTLVVRATDAAVIVGIVQQGIVVARTLLACVAQRLIALRPFLVRAAAEISDGHASKTIRGQGGSLPC
jgi:hypothetical protein